MKRSILPLLLVAGCSVPAQQFTPLDDGGVDAGEVRLVIPPGTITVGERATATFTVALSAPPLDTVRIAVASSDDVRLGVMPGTIDIDASTWSVPRAITVTGKADTDVDDELVSVLLAAAVGDAAVPVTIDDDDDLGIVATPGAGLQVDENATAPLMVRLNAAPAGDMAVTVTSSDTSIATASPARSE